MNESSSTPTRRRPLWVTTLVGTFVGALLVIAASLVAIWWMYTTSSGLRFLVLLNSRLNTALVVRDVSGSLRDGFTAGSFSLSGPTWSMQATDITVEPHELIWRQRSFDFERVEARTVIIDYTKSGDPATPPTSLASPVDLRLRNLTIGELRFGERDSTPTVVSNISAAARLNADEISIERAAFQHGPSRVSLSGRIDARSPFALRAEAQIASTLREHSVGASLSASGTLLDAFVELSSDGADARVRASARLTPFAPVALAQLSADIDHLNLPAWVDGAPAMRLRGNVDLKPIDAAAGFTLAGPFSIDNLDAGPVDRKQVPVRSARGSLTWSAATLTLTLQRVEGIRGSASGGLNWSQADGLTAKLALSGIDASTIHSSAAATRIDGALNYSLIDQVQRFVGTLRTDSVRLPRGDKTIQVAGDFNLILRDQVLDIETARVRLADGRAELTGRVELRGNYAARVNGKFDNLDLALLVKGLDTRLNGSVDLDARFKPTMAGRAQVALADSRLKGRPLDGRATIELADQRIDVDADVTSRSARLTARGGLGSKRELQFELLVPKLSELMPSMSGGVTAQGTISGEFAAPQLRVDATGENLKLPNGHTIESVIGSVAGGAAPSAPLAVLVKLAGHRSPNPAASLANATLIGHGVTAGHSLELNGMTQTQQPARLIASGGWIAKDKQQSAWRGFLVAAETGLPLELRLREAVPLTIAAGSLSFGPARFEARGTQFSSVDVQQRDGKWETSGIFEGLRPQTLDASVGAQRRLGRTESVKREPLTLQGRWKIELTDTLTGILIVERSSGDIFGGIDALNPIGVRDLGLAVNVLKNRITGTAYVRGQALGRLDAVIDAYMETSGGIKLARDRPFRIDIDAVLPDLSWIGPLIGDSVQAEGSGTIKASISGTPADPTASGPIRATGLRLAYVEQGLRLENGTLDASLEDGVLVVNELQFTGSPRIAPDDRRASESVSFETPGRLRAIARIALRTLTGSVGIVADRLPVLQRSDRWMVVSGEGGITLAPEKAQLYAKLQVDGAFIDFSRLRGTRSLPNDVVVVRTQQQPKEDTAAVDVTLDVQGNLGRRFYIRGVGLDARLAGELNITGRPGRILAEGNVRTVGGTYQGYGQRLQIERGILTFQGPIENPALNVLAVRSGLPVDVGVSIGGTAVRPIVRLYSDPAMSEVEKLNWLVLGRPPSAAGDGQERALLSAAASALFAGQTDDSSSRLIRSFGIDDISLRPGLDSSSILPRETVAGTLRSATGATAASDFVVLGRRLTDDLQLTVEQAVSGAATYVALNYQISRRFSVVARAGTTTALDLVYSIAFD